MADHGPDRRLGDNGGMDELQTRDLEPDAAAWPIDAVEWDGEAAVIIDQRELPERLVRWRLTGVDEVVEAIRTLAVRGAPAIGIAGAYGVVLATVAPAMAPERRTTRGCSSGSDGRPSASPMPGRRRSTCRRRSSGSWGQSAPHRPPIPVISEPSTARPSRPRSPSTPRIARPARASRGTAARRWPGDDAS